MSHLIHPIIESTLFDEGTLQYLHRHKYLPTYPYSESIHITCAHITLSNSFQVPDHSPQPFLFWPLQEN